MKFKIDNSSRFLQERNLVFSQGRSQKFLVSTDSCVWNKCKLQPYTKLIGAKQSHSFGVFGFPNCARARLLVQSPPQAGTSLWPCVGVVFRATHYVCHVSRGDQLRHMAKDLCQPRGGFAQVKRALAHDLGKPKTMAAKRKCMCTSLALALVVPHGTTDQEGLGPQ